jgi:hypothetical protein
MQTTEFKTESSDRGFLSFFSMPGGRRRSGAGSFVDLLPEPASQDNRLQSRRAFYEGGTQIAIALG